MDYHNRPTPSSSRVPLSTLNSAFGSPRRSTPNGGAATRSTFSSSTSHIKGPYNYGNIGGSVASLHSTISVHKLYATRPLVIPPAPTIAPPTPPTSSMRPSTSDGKRALTHPDIPLPPAPDHDLANEVYTRLLIPKKRGYPLWSPRSRRACTSRHRQSGTRIGDVGILTTHGDFEFLFNICLPSSDQINENLVPDDFQPLDPGFRDVEVKKVPGASPPGSCLMSGSVQIDHPRDPSAFDGSYRFTCESKEGAILVLPDGSIQEDLVDIDHFSTYAGNNAIQWYRYAQATRGRPAPNGSLYLITGYDKARSWGTASFTGVRGACTFPLNFSNSKLDGASSPKAYGWNQSAVVATNESLPTQKCPMDEESPQNEAVFLRGFQVTLAETVWNSMVEEESVRSISEQCVKASFQKCDGAPEPGGMRQTPSGRSLPSTVHRDGGATVACDVPRSSMAHHPSDIINSHLLNEMPDAKLAITHDSVWVSLLEDDTGRLPETPLLLQQLRAKYDIGLRDGVITLTPKEAKDRSSSGSGLSQPDLYPFADDSKRSSGSSLPKSGMGFGRQRTKAAEDTASIKTSRTALGLEPPSVDLHPAVVAYQAARPGRPLPKLGPWLLLQKLGDSESRKVRLGVHIKSGMEAAVRLIKREKGNPSSQLRAVEKELRALQTLKHPNIGRLLDVVETDKYIAAMLEYIPGGELIDYILVHHYLDEQEAARLFSQLISAVWYMHQKGVFHRNIKLETLLLDEERNLIVTNFDYAHLEEALGDVFLQSSCGSPLYAAPELVMGQTLYLGGPIDVWACGVVLYAMLAGYMPFDDDPSNPQGASMKLLYKRITTEELQFPSRVTEPARDILRKMLAPDPADRITIEELLNHDWLTTCAPPIAAPQQPDEVRPISYFPTTAFGLGVDDMESRAEAKYRAQQEHCASQLRGISSRCETGSVKGFVPEDLSYSMTQDVKPLATRVGYRGAPRSHHGPVRPHTSAGERDRVTRPPTSPLAQAVSDQGPFSAARNPLARSGGEGNREERRRKTLPSLIRTTGGRFTRSGRGKNDLAASPEEEPRGSLDSAFDLDNGPCASADRQRSSDEQRCGFRWARVAMRRLHRNRHD